MDDDYFSVITITIKIPDEFKLLRGKKMKVLTNCLRKILRKFLDDHGYAKDGYLVEVSNN
jgi:hypothetical protein